MEELFSALHDIGAVLSRPALVRLAKIAQVAEQVAAHDPGPAGDPRRPAQGAQEGPR